MAEPARDVAEQARDVAEQARNVVCHQWRCNNKYRVLRSASACWQAILDATRSAQLLRQWFEWLIPYKWFWEEVYGCGEHAAGD